MPLPLARVVFFALGFSAILVASAAAQGISVAQSQLIVSPTVRREIGLTKEQAAEIDKIFAESRKTEAEIHKTFQARRAEITGEVEKRLAAEGRADAKLGVASLPPEAAEAVRRLAAESDRAREESKGARERRLRGTLTPGQFRRLMELVLQRLGPHAFLDEDVLRRLNVDDAKRDEIREIFEAYEGKRRAATETFLREYNAVAKAYIDEGGAVKLAELARARAENPAIGKAIEASNKKRVAVTEDLLKGYTLKILKTLTRRQQETYKKMLGEPFDFFKPVADDRTAPTPAEAKKPAPSPADAPRPKSLRERRGAAAPTP